MKEFEISKNSSHDLSTASAEAPINKLQLISSDSMANNKEAGGDDGIKLDQNNNKKFQDLKYEFDMLSISSDESDMVAEIDWDADNCANNSDPESKYPPLSSSDNKSNSIPTKKFSFSYSESREMWKNSFVFYLLLVLNF